MNKRLVKKQNHISIEKFLRDYCGIENENLIKMLTSLSHRELKEVCRDIYKIPLHTISFENVRTEDLNRGKVLFVNDTFSNTAPYVNPKQITQELIEKKPQKDYEMDYEDIIDIIEDNLTLENVKLKSIGSFTVKGSR